MKRNLLLILLTTFVGSLMAVPANPEPYKVLQPDSTIITLRLMGDEYCHWREAMDGLVVVQDSNGYWVYATVKNGELAPSSVRVAPDEYVVPAKIVSNQYLIRELIPNRHRGMILVNDSAQTSNDKASKTKRGCSTKHR